MEAALATLAQARPPGVYKQDFLDVLSHRYGDDQWLIGPPWPAWCEKRERAKGDEQYKVSGIDEIASGVIESSSQEEIPSCTFLLLHTEVLGLVKETVREILHSPL